MWRFSDVTDPPKTIVIPDFFTEMNLVTHKLSNALSLVVIRHFVVFILSGMSNCTLLSTPDLKWASSQKRLHLGPLRGYGKLKIIEEIHGNYLDKTVMGN